MTKNTGFVMLHSGYNEEQTPMWVRSDNIVHIVPVPNGGSVISIEGSCDEVTSVIESPEEIIRLIEIADVKQKSIYTFLTEAKEACNSQEDECTGCRFLYFCNEIPKHLDIDTLLNVVDGQDI